MKNTKELLGKIKNIVLISVVMFSLLILFSDIIYNNILITLILKLVAMYNVYCFVSVNSDYIINK
mgnify:CR=1 FL=1